MVAWMAVALVQVQAAVPCAALVRALDGECVVPSAAANVSNGEEITMSPYCVRRASGPGAASGRHSSTMGQPGASGGGNAMSVDALARVMYHQGGSLAVDGSVMSLVASASTAGRTGHVKYIGTLFPGIVDQRSGQVLARCRVVTDIERDDGGGAS
ncbi:hypothetical protein BCR44DRAFT_33561 [Catenaria anguillulae PL171]|uniref:Dirigent protein n=1 Tax=Catenaria anguillulae PL171 TaxID=765915 RepID=A0A1Y2HM13_9FUNG|nr:hypothetical protein BCR44DRAFT_33561 [Catenaria anguillulae PL171]